MYGKRMPLCGAALVALVTLTTACGDDPTGVLQGDIGRDDAAFLALQLSGLGEQAVDQEVAQLGVAASGDEGLLADAARGPGFLRARECPAGGELQIDGEINFSFDGATLEVTFEAQKTMDDCAFERGDELFTVNGDLESTGTRTRVDGEPSGPQVTTVEGAVAVTIGSTGETKDCEIDVTSVYDPESGTRELTGTFCGHDVGERADSDG